MELIIFSIIFGIGCYTVLKWFSEFAISAWLCAFVWYTDMQDKPKPDYTQCIENAQAMRVFLKHIKTEHKWKNRGLRILLLFRILYFKMRL